MNVRVPQINNVETAVLTYYAKVSLSNRDIKDLFGNISSSTVYKLKLKAKAQQEEDERMSYNSSTVNTESAYKAWGLDIDELERRLTKLRKLKKNNPSA